MGIFSSKISDKTLVPLCRQLANSYEAGIPILRALQLAADHTSDSTARRVMRAMAQQIQAGGTLAEAARAQQHYLPLFVIELLATGEAGGRLDVMLRDLAEYYETRLEMSRRFVAMMVLPVLQLIAAWFLGSFSLGLISRLHLDARSPFSLDAYFHHYLHIQAIALCVAAVVFVACIILARLGILRWIWGWIATYIWPLSILTRKYALARFFRALSLLIASGMSIRLCIERAAAVTGNPYIERDLLGAVPLVMSGHTLVQAFSVSSSLTPVAREMLAIGEHSGKLEESLRKVAQYHMEEAVHAMQVVGKVLGIVVTLATAATIGYVVISFWSKYFGMLNSIQ